MKPQSIHDEAPQVINVGSTSKISHHLRSGECKISGHKWEWTMFCPRQVMDYWLADFLFIEFFVLLLTFGQLCIMCSQWKVVHIMSQLLHALQNTTARISCHALYFSDETYWLEPHFFVLYISNLHVVNIVQYRIFACSDSVYWLWYGPSPIYCSILQPTQPIVLQGTRECWCIWVYLK